MARTQLFTALESSKWAYYQAKSIKQNLAESQKNAFEVEMLGAVNADQKALYESKLKTVEEEISRYDSEKNQIKKEAEDTAASNKLIARKGNFFTGSVVFFQIGIMFSSVTRCLRENSCGSLALYSEPLPLCFWATAYFCRRCCFNPNFNYKSGTILISLRRKMGTAVCPG